LVGQTVHNVDPVSTNNARRSRSNLGRKCRREKIPEINRIVDQIDVGFGRIPSAPEDLGRGVSLDVMSPSEQGTMSNYSKTAILEVYRYGTLPYRIVSRRRLARRDQMPVVILYYHRVADTDPVPWSLTNVQFQRHIDWLQSRYDMISLEEAQRRVAKGSSRPSVHITFDDGYAENCDRALPLLVERGIPCTYFVTLDNITSSKPFIHDQNRGGEFPVNSIAQLRELAEQGGGYNHVGDDTFHLQRCHGDPELMRLRNAITFDPRHVRKQKAVLETDGQNVSAALSLYHAQNRSVPQLGVTFAGSVQQPA
jgi:hypothetical protein